ncbi:hypothetical protein NQ318_015284 [Aromia moschata]|uniref:Mutator-like transposase domain-containing protein n=1 Tax=Aromia moschata TaxID=1265417 RepID=A0AAV8XE95_9CUCU|nr:hypothetical protein NQ318_015284 [Aromia moschata]
MEVDSILDMFKRSEEIFGVKYYNYIGDGDSKTFKAILDAAPYGEELVVKKSECIGHVQKRMGTRLRNVKKQQKIGGKGKLTDALIKKLSTYYGLAIRRNTHSVEEMKKAILATYFHLCSTDDNPNHSFCPDGEDSWCQWKKAEALGANKDLLKHSEPLHPDVQKYILPIYEDLTKDDLLQRCLGGRTQNANESYNSTIWRLAPKHLNSGLKIIEIAAYVSASIFNEGHSTVLRIMSKMDIIVGRQSHEFAESKDAFNDFKSAVQIANSEGLRRASPQTDLRGIIQCISDYLGHPNCSAPSDAGRHKCISGRKAPRAPPDLVRPQPTEENENDNAERGSEDEILENVTTEPEETNSQGTENEDTQAKPLTGNIGFKSKRLNESVGASKVDQALGSLKNAASYNELKGDECGVYGEHVAHKFRSYSKKTRAVVQHHINNIFSADMGQYDIGEGKSA